MKYELEADRVAKEELRRTATTVLLGAAVLIPGAWAVGKFLLWLGSSSVGLWLLPYEVKGESDYVMIALNGIQAVFWGAVYLTGIVGALSVLIIVFYGFGCLLRKCVHRVGLRPCHK